MLGSSLKRRGEGREGNSVARRSDSNTSRGQPSSCCRRGAPSISVLCLQDINFSNDHRQHSELTALGPDATELFLEVDDDELVEEGEIVAGVPAVPDSQENQGAQLTDVSVVHELQSLVNIVHHLEQHHNRDRIKPG